MHKRGIIVISIIVLSLLLAYIYSIGKADNTFNNEKCNASVKVGIKLVSKNGTVIFLDCNTYSVLGYYSYKINNINVEENTEVHIYCEVTFSSGDMKNLYLILDVLQGKGAPKSNRIDVSKYVNRKGVKESISVCMGTVKGLCSGTGSHSLTWKCRVTLKGTGLDGKTYSASKSFTVSLNVKVEYIYTPYVRIDGVNAGVSYDTGYNPFYSFLRTLSLLTPP